MITTNLPSVIVLYGPPLAGKGTQADFLEKKLNDYIHLDFGTELRNYVKIGLAQSTDQDMKDRATRLDQMMTAGIGVETADLRFVVEEKVTSTLKSGKKLLIEGPGRKIEEAKWLAAFFSENNIEVAIFHLHLSLDEVLHRSKTRWYSPENALPFLSYETAKAGCKSGEEPYQRVEDQDPAINTRRYSDIYLNVFAKIIETYQLECLCKVLTVDAADTIDQVSQTIVKYLNTYYNFKI